MRFFIISKKMFKKSKDEEKEKQRFYKKKSFLILASCVLLVAGVAIFAVLRAAGVPAEAYCEQIGKFRLEAHTQEDREKFFEQFSYSAQEVAVQQIVIPCESLQFEEYNEIQKSQGLDLMPYCGKSAKMYTLKLVDDKNAEEQKGETQLFGVLIVYKDRVVAAHLTDFLYPACIKALTG